MQYFDVEAKAWKPLTSLAPATEARICYCAETVGNKLFVGDHHYSMYCYDIEQNVWETLQHPYSGGEIAQLCSVDDYIYAFSSDCNKIPQRYNFAERQWQSFAKVNRDTAGSYLFNSGATVLYSKVFVLHGKALLSKSGFQMQNAVLHCFDSARNVWVEKALTCKPHFGSSLFVVNRRLYVAGGYDYTDMGGKPCGNPASVEVNDEENNKWTVVEQKHIAQNKLGAVELEGRVYFIINKFPIDSGIRIPPGEVYPVPLSEWKNLENTSTSAVLCYVLLKRESLKAE